LLDVEIRKLVARRFLTALITLFLLSVFVFYLLYLAPGEPAELIIRARMQGEFPSSPEVVAVLKKEMGLDAPPQVLYMRWAGGVLHGELGYSYVTLRPTASILSESFMATAELVAAAMFLVIFFGISLGLLSAWKEDSKLDSLIGGLAVLGISVPNYVIAFIGILVFAVALHLLPVAGRSGLSSVLLPAVSLAASEAAVLIRLTRYNLIEEKRQNYVLAARAKGLGEREIFLKHIFRNALLPLITYVGLQLGWLFSMTVIIEKLFSWPGLGMLLVDSVLSNDIPLVQGSILLIGSIFICINLVVDILYIYIDPRVKPEGVL
jgi:peptide/nickel transport system permease protein